MATLFLAVVVSVFALVYCANHTVTEEVWFDVEIKDYDGPGDDYRGRLVIALFGETCPMTTMNFAAIAKGFKMKNEFLSYKNSRFHRIVQDMVIQGGDITVGDGTGGKSIFGDKFIDENFKLSHKSTGFVSMANHGPDTNGSQFFIVLNKARWLDNRHVVFGKVDVIRTISNVPTSTANAEPKKTIRIFDSGVVGLDKKYDLTMEQVLSEEDIA
ncbi:hypothetical protein ScPMuIL_013688 [Solemya velum]